MASIMCTYANDDHFTYRPVSRATDNNISFPLKLAEVVIQHHMNKDSGGKEEDSDAEDSDGEEFDLLSDSDDDRDENSAPTFEAAPVHDAGAPALACVAFVPVPPDRYGALDDDALLLHCQYFRVVATPKGQAPATNLAQVLTQYNKTKGQLVDFLKTNAVHPYISRHKRIPQLFVLKHFNFLSAQPDFLHIVMLGLWKLIIKSIPGEFRRCLPRGYGQALDQFNNNMERIMNEASFPGQKTFADGIFNKDHKVIANLGGSEMIQIVRVGFVALRGCLSATAGPVPACGKKRLEEAESNIMRAWIALLNWHALVILPAHSEDTLDMVDTAYAHFLDTLPVACPSKSQFNSQKIMWARSFSRCVLTSGRCTHHCSSHFERSHIEFVKQPARRTNFRQELKGIADRLELLCAQHRSGIGLSQEGAGVERQDFEVAVSSTLDQLDETLRDHHVKMVFSDSDAGTADPDAVDLDAIAAAAPQGARTVHDLGVPASLARQLIPDMEDNLWARLVHSNGMPWLHMLPAYIPPFLAAATRDEHDHSVATMGNFRQIEMFNSLDMGPAGQKMLLRANPGLKYSRDRVITRFDCAELYTTNEDKTQLCRCLSFFRCWDTFGTQRDCVFAVVYRNKGVDPITFNERFETDVEHREVGGWLPVLRVYDVKTIKKMVQLLPDMTQAAPKVIGAGVDLPTDAPSTKAASKFSGKGTKEPAFVRASEIAAAATDERLANVNAGGLQPHRGEVNRWLELISMG
jgi:hypothetical protein